MAYYKKLSDSANTNGMNFELKTAALLYLRGINSGLDFQLATNVEGAGYLSDIVFQFKTKNNPEEWTTVFLALEHKQNDSLKISSFRLSSEKDGFNLRKYYKSYCTIKGTMSKSNSGLFFDGNLKRCKFNLYTNAELSSFEIDKFRFGCVTSEEEVFLGSDSVTVLECSELVKAPFATSEGGSGVEFLDRFRVFCGQPSGSGLDGLIEDELRKIRCLPIHDVDHHYLYYCFLERVSEWFNRSDTALDSSSDLLRTALDSVILQSCTTLEKKIYYLDVFFDETALLPLRELLKRNVSVIHIESSESSSRLSCTKLLQAVKGAHLFLDCKTFLGHREVVTSKCKNKELKSLVMRMDSDDFCLNLKEVCSYCVDTVQLIVLSKTPTSVLEELAAQMGRDIACVTDTFSVSQLDSRTQHKLRNMMFKLQGYDMTLETLFSGKLHEYLSDLDASTSLELLVSIENSSVGPSMAEEISFFVPRTIEKRTALKESILEVPENTTAVFSSMKDLAIILDATNTQKVEETLEAKSRSPLIPDQDDALFSSSEKYELGTFECQNVVLRHGQVDQVTATRIHHRANPPNRGWFLFVPNGSTERDVDALSGRNESNHRLQLEGGKLRWLKSRGRMDSIRAHVDETRVTSLRLETVADVDDRLVLICAEPGSGKTTLMAHLAKATKDALPLSWVVNVSLNDHVKLLAQDEHRDGLEFLLSAARVESRLHKSLFKFALEVNGNVVVLLDAFDEIAPKYEDEFCALLSSLLQTKANKIWITSRNSAKSSVEDHLSTLSVKLHMFDANDQRFFLEKYLLKDHKTLAVEELDLFIKRLLQMTSETFCTKEDQEFLGIPLQIQMLAEVFQDQLTCSLPEKLDLLELLDKFVEEKLDIYVQEKLKIHTSHSLYHNHLDSVRRNFVSDHMIAALNLILTNKQLEELPANLVRKTARGFFSEKRNDGDRIGIIDSVVDGKPRFTHRIFAEYFVAKWFANHFVENAVVLRSKLFSSDFRVIRDIFDRLLARGCPLHSAVLNEDVVAVSTLLAEEGVDIDATDNGGRTALHLAAALGTSNDRRENVRRNDILNLLIAGTTEFDQRDMILHGAPLRYAEAARSTQAVEKLTRLTSDAAATDEEDEASAIRLRSRSKVTELKGYGIDFDEHHLKRFASAIPRAGILNVCVNSRTTVSSVKVMKALAEYRPDKRNVLHVDSRALLRNREVVATWARGCCDTLVVECDFELPPSETLRLCDQIVKVVEKEGNKKLLVLIGSENHQLIAKLNVARGCSVFRDNSNWCHLAEKTQAKLLSAEIKLQGKTISLRELECVDFFNKVDSNVLSQLLKRDTRCGKDLGEDGRRTKPADVKPTDKVVLVAAEPGPERTAAMTRLACSAAAEDPLAWVVRVDLGECTQQLAAMDLAAFYGVAARTFLERVALAPGNSLERALFWSLEHKLVIFVDGIDDVWPRYERQTLALLGCLKDLKVRRLWVASRPLYATKLGVKLGVEARNFATHDRALFSDKI